MKKLDSNNMFDGELFFLEHENNNLYTYSNQHNDTLLIVDSETRVILFVIVAHCTQNTGYLKVKKD